MGVFDFLTGGDGGKKPPKKPGKGKNAPAKPRKTTQKPKRGNKPGS